MARKGIGHRRSQRPVRSARRRVLIVCGGRVTEPQYFTGLRDHLDSRSVYVRVAVEDKSPHYILKKAAGDLRTGDFDEAWCAFDVDDFDCDPVIGEARRLNINIALSHPCFDLWLLLHFEDCVAHLDGYPAVKKRLRRHMPDYGTAKSGKSVDFADYQDNIAAAVRRAKRLEQRHEKPHSNPSTGIWRLVESIMEGSE